jgi:hypothetical protein
MGEISSRTGGSSLGHLDGEGVEVSDATDGADALFSLGNGAQLLAEAADVNVNAAVKGAERTSERGLGKLFAGDDHSGAAEEKLKHVEFGSSQLNGDAVAKGSSGEQRERDISDGEGFIARRVIVVFQRTAQNGADAGDEFAGIEGLGDIVIGTDLKAEDAVHGFSTGGEENDGNAGVSPQGLEKFKAGAAGKHDIKDDHVVFAGERGLKAGAMIEDSIDLKALVLQKALEEGDQSLVVVNDEYAAHGFHFARVRGRWL